MCTWRVALVGTPCGVQRGTGALRVWRGSPFPRTTTMYGDTAAVRGRGARLVAYVDQCIISDRKAGRQPSRHARVAGGLGCGKRARRPWLDAGALRWLVGGWVLRPRGPIRIVVRRCTRTW